MVAALGSDLPPQFMGTERATSTTHRSTRVEAGGGTGLYATGFASLGGRKKEI